MTTRRAGPPLPFVCLLTSIAALLVAYSVAQLLLTPAGHDQTWYLYAAERLLAGTELYGPHLVETNPPLIIWFSTIPVVVSRLLHIEPYLVFEFLILVMALGSITWSLLLLRRKSPEPRAFSLTLFGTALITAEFLQFAGFPFGGTYLGQREQLMAILVFPYVISRATRVTEHLGFAERCALGVAAGLAVCFKPQQLLVLVCLELSFVLYTRRLRCLISPELMAAVLTGASYVLLVWTLTPRYVTQVVPLLRITYWAVGGTSITNVLMADRHFAAYLLLIVIAGFLLIRRIRDRLPVYALFSCLLGATLAYLLQRKGWPYQVATAKVFLCFLAFYLLFQVMESAIDRMDAALRVHSAATILAFAIVFVLLVSEAVQIRKVITQPSPLQRYEIPAIDSIAAHLKPGTPVSVLATSLTAFPPIFGHHLIWASRYPHLWLLPAIVRNEMGSADPDVVFKRLPPDTVASLANLLRTDTAEDLDFWQPPLVLVEQCKVQSPCPFLGAYDFDMLGWFLRSPRFQSAWSHYGHESDISGFAVYEREN